MSRRPMATRIEPVSTSWQDGWTPAERIADAVKILAATIITGLAMFYGLSELVIRGVVG